MSTRLNVGKRTDKPVLKDHSGGNPKVVLKGVWSLFTHDFVYEISQYTKWNVVFSTGWTVFVNIKITLGISSLNITFISPEHLLTYCVRYSSQIAYTSTPGYYIGF